MADYTQPDVVNKRVRFFDGQFLQDQDLIDEQRYHLDRERRQSRLLSVTGIVAGLTVTRSGPYQVTVAKGMAVDSLGRQLILAADLALRLTDRFAKQQGVELYLVYQESPTDVAQTGGKSARRWDESPKIVALAPDGAVAVAPEGSSTTYEGPSVLLARLAVADNGDVTVDGTAARKAGLSVPGAVGIGTAGPPWKLSVSSSREHLALYREGSETVGGAHVFLELAQVDSDPARVPEVFPSIRFHHHNRFWHRIEGQGSGIHFKTGAPASNDYSDIKARSISATGRLEVSGGGGTNVDLVVNGRLRSNNNDGGLWVAEDRFVGGHATNQIGFFNGNAWRLTVLPSGNVGIGTTNPSSDLEIGNFDARNRYLTLKVSGGHQYRSGIKLWTWKENYGYSLEYDERTAMGDGLHIRTHEQSADGTTRLFLNMRGDVGIGTTAPENADGWNKVVDILGSGHTKLSVRTAAIDSRVMAHDSGGFGAPAGMLVGTKSNHPLSFVTNAATRLYVSAAGYVGIGTTGPPWKLSVSSSRDHLALYREASETVGGAHVFLELAQVDSDPARVPEVFPSIRFHHHNRFWHRIEGQGSGIHFKTGAPASNDYSDIRARTVTSSALRIGAVTIGEDELAILKKLAAGNLEFDLYNVKQDEYAYAGDYAPYDNDRRRIFTWRPKGRINQGRWQLHYPY